MKFALPNLARPDLTGYWHRFSPREQRLFLMLGIVALIVAAYYGAFRPLQRANDAARRDIATYQALNARLATIEPSGDEQAEPAEQRSGPAPQIVQGAASELDLSPARVTADGEGVRAVLTDAPFDSVIAWIAEVERSSALRIRQIRITRRPTPGLVSADLLFAP